MKKRASEIFQEIDTDGNGKIDVTELKTAMITLGVALKQSEAEAMMMEADADGCAGASPHPCTVSDPVARASLPY